MAKRKWKRRKYSHGFKTPTGKFYVECVDAKEPVMLNNISRRYFVLGDPMQECSCAITEFGLTNAHMYPHKVYWIETTRTFHYVVDRLDSRGGWSRCVRYKHNMTKGIDEFDSPGGKARLLRDRDLKWDVRLSVPQRRGPQTSSGAAEGNEDGSRNLVVHRKSSPFSRDRWMRALKRHQAAKVSQVAA